jgi:single-stranded-DNA-specific exonuclease
MKAEWKLKPVADEEEIRRLNREVGPLEPAIWQLLIRRGLTTKDAARDFLRPGRHLMHDPFLMKDMDRAVERLTRAVASREQVLVYGDYDVDGTTAVALVYSFLRDLGVPCTYYVPDRFEEGYGFSMKGVEFAAAHGYSLIITLDCGIKDGERIRRAAELGMEVIVCDHHNPDEIPEAAAVLDPKRPDCPYPFKGLSGCGVGFKMLQAYCTAAGLEEETLFRHLDLLAISIAADIVPVTGENRYFAGEGLKVLQQSPRRGIREMLRVAGFKKKSMTISDVVFTIAPRINAAGRIMSGRNAVRLLISDDDDEIREMGKLLEENNVTRKSLDRGITDAAVRMVEEDAFYRTSFSTVVWGEEWSKGVVGIVASRLVETYYKPTIVLTRKDDHLAGSARSIPGIDLYEILNRCQDLLTQFGGHPMAAGLSLPGEQVPGIQGTLR